MGLEVKIDLNEGKMADYAESAIKAELLKGAVKLIVEQFSPERLTTFVEKVLTKAVDQFNDWELQKQIKEQAQPAMKKALADPAIQQRIDDAVAVAVENAVRSLPSLLEKEITESLQTTIKRRMRGEKDDRY